MLHLNLTEIKRISEELSESNYKFRSLLKWHDNPDEIDRVVQELYLEISSKIDCTLCANCCNIISPTISTEEIDTISSYKNVSTSDFISIYLMNDDERNYVFKDLPCPFLKDNKCTCYPNRPNDCKSYPHLNKNDITSRLLGVIENCSICPIVFNVFENLKKYCNY